jgi:predicted regulator of Ras-like GTPase activity (Roadblock/LC7/MglB family)
MNPLPHQEAALQQLAAVPGVVGSLVFDAQGEVVASVFPPVFDGAGLRTLSGRLSADAYFQDWLAGEGGALELRYADGDVLVRSLDGSWLLVLCTAQANPQLLSMSLTQVVRRLRIQAPTRTGEFPLPGATPAPAPSTLERMRAVATAELGEHAAQALEILAAAGPKPKDLRAAARDVEKLTRLFISKTKADEINHKMREILGG